MDKPLNLYEKLHMLAYEVAEVAGGESIAVVRDPDMVQVYHTLIRMRWALLTCRDQFTTYLNIDEDHREDSMTLVERQGLNERIERHTHLVKTLNGLIKSIPELPGAWLDIATAPQTGKPIRLLGKRSDGTTYIETGRWENILWSTQRISGYEKPTHWMALEALPEGYQ